MLKKSPQQPEIVMERLDELYLASEAPKGVELEVRNSGRGSPMSDAELKASLYRAGVIQPLIWKSYDSKKYVVAGNRRLRFLREIFADAPSTLVQTQNVDGFEGDWREIAIDTNLSLPPHLVERYEIIVKLAADLKLSEKETCTRFGMSDSQYRRVMALGKMAPVVRQAWKDGTIDAKTAQIFTLEPDPKEQERIFSSLSKGAGGVAARVMAWDVQRRIVPQTQQEISRLVTFIGLPTLRKEGLLKQEDFFATETSAHHIVTDVKALNKLVADRLMKACELLVASGWKWAMPEGKIEGNSYNYADLTPKKVTPTKEEKTRMAEIEQSLRDMEEADEFDMSVEEALEEERSAIEQAIALRGFTPEQLAKGGCFVKISQQGDIAIEYGKVRPAERKAVAASERSRTKAAAPTKPKKPGDVGLTNALAERLSLSLQKGIAAAVIAKPHVAVCALIAGFASSGHVVDVDIGTRQAKYVSPETNAKNFLQVFEGALAATPESRVMMLAKIVSEALSIQIHSADAKPPMADLGLDAFVAAMSALHVDNAIKSFFDADDYFGSISLTDICEAVSCTMGADHVNKVAKMKKADAAKYAATNLPGLGYLPPMLRTVHYKGPREAVPVKAAKKDKKPKPVKKAAKKKTRK